MHRRKLLRYGIVASIGGLAGCTENLPIDEQSQSSTKDTEADDNSQTELQQLGLRLEEQYEEDVDGISQTVWELQNTGNNKFLATNAFNYSGERRFPGKLRISGFDNEIWQYGIGPGANIKITQNMSQRIDGKAYLPEDVPLSPPSDTDVIVESPEWTTESIRGSVYNSLTYEFENPTSLDLSNVQEISPDTVEVANDSTLKYAARARSDVPQTWIEPLEVSLTTTTGEESFTLAPAQVPEYDVEITRVGRKESSNDPQGDFLEVSFDVIAQNEVGIFDCRAAVFKWPQISDGVSTAMAGAQKIGQGEDWGLGSPLVVDTTGQDRIGQSVSYTIQTRYVNEVLELPLEEDAEIGVMIMPKRTPVAYSEKRLTDVLDEDSL